MKKYTFEESPAVVEIPSKDGWIKTVVEPFKVGSEEYYLSIENQNNGQKFEAYIYDALSGTVMFEDNVTAVYQDVYSKEQYDVSVNRHLILQKLNPFFENFLKWIDEGQKNLGKEKIQELKQKAHTNVVKNYGTKPNEIGKVAVPAISLYPIGNLSRIFQMKGDLFSEIWEKTDKKEPTTMDRIIELEMPANLPNNDKYKIGDICGFVEVGPDGNTLSGRYVVTEILEVSNADDKEYAKVKMIWKDRYDFS